MAEQRTGTFRIGDWLVEPGRGRAVRGEEVASLRPREMDLLVYLARRPGEVVRIDDIMRDVWAGVEVTNDSLYYSISQLRKILDAGSAQGSLIETIPKRGYRLTAAAEAPGVDDAAEPADAGQRPAPGAGWSRQHAVAVAAAIVVGLIALFWFAATDDGVPPAGPLPAAQAEAGSIAVMPFIDLTPEADYTYFSDGVTEEILNQLTRIPGLRVAARTSSFTFKDSDADVVEIGRQLGVANLLEGSVRKEGDRVRIAVQLIDAATGFQVWSESFDRELVSVFQVQNEISRRVSDALQLALAGGPADGGEPASAAALDEYLIGLEAMRVSSFDSLRAAENHFSTALEMDPNFDNARVQLAAAKLQLLNTGASSDRALVDEAGRLVADVLDRHPDDAGAHRVYGVVLKWQKEWDRARGQFERALEIAPSDSESMLHLAQACATSGDIEEARRLTDRAMRIDPFSVSVLHGYAHVQRKLGASDLALQAMQRAIALHPDNPNPPWVLGQLQVAEFGRLADGLESFLRSAETDPSDYEIAAYVAAAYLALELPDAALPWIDKARELGPENAITTRAVSALYEAVNGDHDAARAIARRGLAEGGPRFMAHSMLTAPLLMLVAGESASRDEAAEAVGILTGRAPGSVEYAGKYAGDDVDPTGLLAVSDLPRRWGAAIAVASKAAGDDAAAQRSLERLATIRIEAAREFRDRVRGDDYLFEAEMRAVEGDADGAFDMLDEAVEKGQLFLWQISYEHNAAFASLREDPRWSAMLDTIRARVAAERRRATAMLGMAVQDAVH